MMILKEVSGNSHWLSAGVCKAQMSDKHFSLKVDLVNFIPAKVLRSFACHVCAYAGMINAHIQQRTAMILYGMRINAVGFKTPGYAHELIHGHRGILIGFTFLVQLNYLLLQILCLTQC